MNRYNFKLCFLLLTCFWSVALGAENPVSLKPEMGRTDLAPHVFWLEDKSSALDMVALQNQKPDAWHKLKKRIFHFGGGRSVFWIRVDFQNKYEFEQLHFLEVGYPKLDYLDLYSTDDDGRLIIKRVGDVLPFSFRDVSNRNFVFRLNVPPGGSRRIYLRVNPGSSSLIVPLHIFSPDEFRSHEKFDYLWLGLVYGALLVIILYNLFVFYSIRDVAYLYYVLLVSGSLLALVSFSGTGFEYFYPNDMVFGNYAQYALFPIWGVCSVLFTIHYLDLKRLAPRVYRFIQLWGLLLTIYVLTIHVFVFNYSEALANRVSGLVMASLLVVNLFVAVRLMLKGNRPAIFLVIAWFIPTIMLVHRMMMSNDWVPASEFVMVWGPHLAFVTEAVLFSMGLADRINLMREELENLNINLEQRVLKRTRTLRSTLRDLKNTEGRLRQSNEELRELDRFKSDFFANISHEFRTPLTLILAPVGALLSEDDDILSPEIRRTLETTQRNSRILLKNINNLLDLSKLDARRLPLIKRNVDLITFLKRTMSNFHSVAASRSIELSFECELESLPCVMDVDRLEQILLNLLSNAFKFTSQAGEGGRVRLSLQAGEGFLEIQVADSGPGIPPDKREKIFERFVQASPNTRGGTGIGLALSRELARLMDGSLELDSGGSPGAIFVLRLPLEEASVEEFPETNSELSRLYISELTEGPLRGEDTIPESVLSEQKLLIVEDQPELRNYLQEIFKPYFPLRLAQNGRDALRQIEVETPDIIISDVMMPEMDGMELLGRVRARKDLQHLTFVLLTARADLDSRFSGLSRGADDYIAKPFHKQELLLKIQNLSLKNILRESAVLKEREQIYADMHDHLGSHITDLSIITGKLLDDEGPRDELLSQLEQAVGQTVFILRNRLLNVEDLKLLDENFAGGLNLILLRRYSTAGRILKFKCDSGAIAFFNNRASDDFKNNLHAIVIEIATNDLKYGSDDSHWRLDLADGFLSLALDSSTSYDAAHQEPGRGSGNIHSRLESLGGRQNSSTTEKGRFELRISIPTSVND